MDNSLNNCIQLMRYDQIYLTQLQPKLKALDCFLKTQQPSYNVYEAADILEIEASKLLDFMEKQNCICLDQDTLFTFILQSSSGLCGYIARQWQFALKTHYTPLMIAEIYDLDLHKVMCAFEDLGVTLITKDQLIDVFKRIHLPVFSYSAK